MSIYTPELLTERLRNGEERTPEQHLTSSSLTSDCCHRAWINPDGEFLPVEWHADRVAYTPTFKHGFIRFEWNDRSQEFVAQSHRPITRQQMVTLCSLLTIVHPRTVTTSRDDRYPEPDYARFTPVNEDTRMAREALGYLAIP